MDRNNTGSSYRGWFFCYAKSYLCRLEVRATRRRRGPGFARKQWTQLLGVENDEAANRLNDGLRAFAQRGFSAADWDI